MKRTRAGVLAGLLLITGAALAIPALAQPAPSSPPQSAPAAPTGRAWSLAAVLEHAVRNSPALGTARIDVAVAEAGVLEASGIEDFLFTATGNFSRLKTESVVTESMTGASELDTITGSMALSKLFWTGATVSLEANTRYISIPTDDGDLTEATSSITASIVQPLLRGRGETVTRAARSRAQYIADQARLQRETAGRTVIRDLIAAYWEVAYAWSDLEIRRSSLDLARERRRLTDASVRGGATAPTEVLAVDQVIAQREEEVVVAELTVTERSLEFRRQAGLEISPTEIDVRVDSPLAAQVQSIEIGNVVALALQRSPEIAALEVQGRGAQLEIEITDNGLLPRLDINVFATPSGTDDTFAGSVENVADGDEYEVGGGLTLQHSFGRRAAKGASRRAQAERQRVRINMADMRRQIAQAAAQAVALARSAERRMQLSRTAIDLTEKNIKAETGRFELGRSTNFDVLLRQEEHTQARLRFARAAADYLRAVAIVEALTGELLTKYGIKVD